MRRALVFLLSLVAAGVATAGAGAAIQVAITSPASGDHSLSGIVPVTVTASADQGIFSVQLDVDGAPYGAPDMTPTGQFQYQIDWNTSGFSQGNHTLTAVATDWSLPGGGGTLTSAPVTVDVGPAYPTATLTSPQAFTFARGSVTIQATTTSAIDPTTVTYAVDGTALPSTSWDTTKTSDGTHAVSVTVRDGRGKTATASSQVTVDNGKPQTSIASPSAGGFFVGTLPAKANASDAFGVATVQFAIDGKPIGSPIAQPDSGNPFQYSASLDLTGLAKGAHQLTSVATDYAGNAATSAAVSFTLGYAPPGISMSLPPDWTFGRGTVTLTAAVTGGDPADSVQFTVDGKAVGSPVTSAPYALQWNTAAVADGTHNISAAVTDSSARKATATAVHLTVDNTAPTVSILSPAANSYAQGTLATQAHASDAFGIKSVQFAIDGNPVGTPVTSPTTSGGFTYAATLDVSSLAGGVHQLTAIGTDAAGNTATSATVAFVIASGPPAVTINIPPDWTLVHKLTSVTADVTGGAAPVSAQLLVDGNPVGAPLTAAPYTFAWDTAGLADGTHTVSVKVTDAASSTVTSAVVHATVDNTPPTGVMYQPTQNTRTNGPTTFQVHASDAYGMKSVQFTVDGNPVGALLTSPDAGQQYLYSTTFDTSTLTPGTHAVSASVTDQAGNVASAASVSITTGPIRYMPVLNYHEILSTGATIYDESPAAADAQMAYLKSNGYTAVTLQQYQQWTAGQDIGIAKPVLITVDDGLNTEKAWDTLFQKYGMKGVLYTITGYVDQTTPGDSDPNNMTWATIQSLAASGRWQIAFHAGQYGHGDSYADGSTIKLSSNQTLSLPAACPYFYTCLGTVTTTTGTGRTQKKTTAAETFSQYQTLVTNEVNAGVTELHQKVPAADSVSWAAPFNDAGQWTNLYNDPSGQVQAWFPGFMASKFPIVFTQTSPVQYGQASGLVGSLTSFGREYRFEVHSDTTIQQFAAALTDPAFAR